MNFFDGDVASLSVGRSVASTDLAAFKSSLIFQDNEGPCRDHVATMSTQDREYRSILHFSLVDRIEFFWPQRCTRKSMKIG